ncbi:MAG TPA: hypothetical protein VFO76_07990, partial [Candidatus Kapabacteria bacterium]|nr:hypothetical protein [Candidatus Kapabacteria bacterium]
GNQLNDSLSSLFVTTISENGKLQSAKRLVPPHRGITVIDAVITPDSALLLTGNIRNPKTPSDDLFAVTLNENTCFTSNTLVVTSHPTVTIDTNYLITPTTIAAPSGTLYNLLSTGSQVDFCSLAAGVSSPPNPTSAICYPNPLEDNRNLTIVFAMPLKAGGYISIIENALGAEVYHRQQRLTGAEQMISLETSDLPAGIYTIELLDPNTFAPVWRGKVVKVN